MHNKGSFKHCLSRFMQIIGLILVFRVTKNALFHPEQFDQVFSEVRNATYPIVGSLLVIGTIISLWLALSFIGGVVYYLFCKLRNRKEFSTP